MFFNDDPELTKHGYYLVNGIKTFSKFEAWQLSGKDMSQIQFIFNDDLFSNYDWTVEPKEDIYELYRRRAEQLRRDYDYIVVVYSGGIDSHTVLETFLQNNIKVDEICTFINAELGEKDKKFNQEIFNAAIPFVQSLDLKKLGTEFRLIDIGRIIVDQLSDEYHFENLEHHGMIHTFWKTAVSSYKLKASIPKHLNLINQGKKVCYIWGHDKPSIKIVNNNYCLYIPDGFMGFRAQQYINRVDLKNKFDNFYDEMFYTCREGLDIAVKQGHMLVNLMKTIPPDDDRIKPIQEITIWGPYVEYQPNRWLSKSTVDQCVYPKAIISMFANDKLFRGSRIFAGKDKWFYDSNHPNKNKFVQKINQIVKDNTGFFRYRPKDPANLSGETFLFGVGFIHSKYYQLSPVN